jgi:hypothetical protein
MNKIIIMFMLSLAIQSKAMLKGTYLPAPEPEQALQEGFDNFMTGNYESAHNLWALAKQTPEKTQSPGTHTEFLPGAALGLGYMHQFGLGVEKDTATAKKHYEEVLSNPVSHNNARLRAKCFLGILLQGENPTKAKELLTEIYDQNVDIFTKAKAALHLAKIETNLERKKQLLKEALVDPEVEAQAAFELAKLKGNKTESTMYYSKAFNQKNDFETKYQVTEDLKVTTDTLAKIKQQTSSNQLYLEEQMLEKAYNDIEAKNITTAEQLLLILYNSPEIVCSCLAAVNLGDLNETRFNNTQEAIKYYRYAYNPKANSETRACAAYELGILLTEENPGEAKRLLEIAQQQKEHPIIAARASFSLALLEENPKRKEKALERVTQQNDCTASRDQAKEILLILSNTIAEIEAYNCGDGGIRNWGKNC